MRRVASSGESALQISRESGWRMSLQLMAILMAVSCLSPVITHTCSSSYTHMHEAVVQARSALFSASSSTVPTTVSATVLPTASPTGSTCQQELHHQSTNSLNNTTVLVPYSISHVHVCAYESCMHASTAKPLVGLLRMAEVGDIKACVCQFHKSFLI